jgi:hypothetical protein
MKTLLMIITLSLISCGKTKSIKEGCTYGPNGSWVCEQTTVSEQTTDTKPSHVWKTIRDCDRYMRISTQEAGDLYQACVDYINSRDTENN